MSCVERRWLIATLAVLLALGGSGVAQAGGKRRSRGARMAKPGVRRVVARAGVRRSSQRYAALTPEDRLREELDAIWQGRILKRGVTAVYVVDAKTGQDVYAVHADDKLNPASNVKLLSTATVLDLLGPTWSYLTRVYGPAPDARGVARGDVYLRGSADPTFAGVHLEELANATARSGVRRIEGDVLLSDDLLRDTIAAPRVKITVVASNRQGEAPTVKIEPSTSYIQIHVAATTTKKRRARLSVTTEVLDPASAAAPPAPGQTAPTTGTVASAPQPAAPAWADATATTATLATPAVSATAAVAPADATALPAVGAPTTAIATQVGIGRAPDAAPPAAYDGPRLLIHVSGTIRAGKTQTYRRSVGLRSTFTGYQLRAALRAAGVEVVGRVRLTDFDIYTREAAQRGWLPIELARHRSGTLESLVARTNKRSVNWLADRLLMTAGAERAGGDRPDMKRGLEAMRHWLERVGVNPAAVVVDTGSGLSHKTQLTARHVVHVLRAAAGFTTQLSKHSLLDPRAFLESLAVGGMDGTLRGRFRSEAMRGKVVGKTGTLNSSVALSGFVSHGSEGDTLCFAIITNGNRWNWRGRVRREHDQMVAAMKRYLDARAARDSAASAAAAAAAAPPPEATTEPVAGDADDDEAAETSETDTADAEPPAE